MPNNIITNTSDTHHLDTHINDDFLERPHKNTPYQQNIEINKQALEWLTHCQTDETREIKLSPNGLSATSRTRNHEDENTKVFLIVLVAFVVIGFLFFSVNLVIEYAAEFGFVFCLLGLIYFLYKIFGGKS